MNLGVGFLNVVDRETDKHIREPMLRPFIIASQNSFHFFTTQSRKINSSLSQIYHILLSAQLPNFLIMLMVDQSFRYRSGVSRYLLLSQDLSFFLDPSKPFSPIHTEHSVSILFLHCSPQNHYRPYSTWGKDQ